ncbi:Glutathione-independent glyoxalase DJR-1.1 [Mycena venus]|uniref:Glutathione-independent glyoxalase DJR-1.1 n=1 Tax=Mycena venus TaxID=2733690 RepID=A0A8H6XL38_9AGAR|nr:Glutathione-independent glyoxalase DJR-1.1 [Mycena venus]
MSKNTAVQSLVREFLAKHKIIYSKKPGSADCYARQPLTSHPSVNVQLENDFDYSENPVVVSNGLVTRYGIPIALTRVGPLYDADKHADGLPDPKSDGSWAAPHNRARLGDLEDNRHLLAIAKVVVEPLVSVVRRPDGDSGEVDLHRAEDAHDGQALCHRALCNLVLVSQRRSTEPEGDASTSAVGPTTTYLSAVERTHISSFARGLITMLCTETRARRFPARRHEVPL